LLSLFAAVVVDKEVEAKFAPSPCALTVVVSAGVGISENAA
jgi:hypothetical protein